jgi:hypothetical protein
MTALRFERWWPYVGALVLFGVWLYFGRPFPRNPEGLMGASGTVAVVFVGFLGTAKAIVLSISNSPVYKRLKETGYSRVLFSYLYESIFSGIVFLVISVLGFFLPERESHDFFAALWVLAGAATILLYIRTTNLLFQLVKQA